MRKLLIAVAAGAAAVALAGQGLAAPAAKDPLCAMGSQSTSQSWQDHYHCWSGPVAKPVAAKPSKKDPLCAMAGTNQSWADHYGCWGPAKRY